MMAVNAIRRVIAKAKDLTVNAGKEMTDDAVLSVMSKGAKQREGLEWGDTSFAVVILARKDDVLASYRRNRTTTWTT